MQNNRPSSYPDHPPLFPFPDDDLDAQQEYSFPCPDPDDERPDDPGDDEDGEWEIVRTCCSGCCLEGYEREDRYGESGCPGGCRLCGW